MFDGNSQLARLTTVDGKVIGIASDLEGTVTGVVSFVLDHVATMVADVSVGREDERTVKPPRFERVVRRLVVCVRYMDSGVDGTND